MNAIYTLQQIETPRLIIRPVCLEDAESLNIAIQNSLETLQRWMPWAQNPTLENTKIYLQQAVTGWKAGTTFQMLMVCKADNHVIGGTGFNQSSDINVPYFEIGYWLETAYEGKGLVTEAVTALTKYAFEACHAIRVQIRAQAENIKSQNIAKRCGYNEEATLKHDRVDCVSKKPANGVLWTCTNQDTLPPLEVHWSHTSNKDITTLTTISSIGHVMIEEASTEEAAYIDNKLGEFNGMQVPLTQTEPLIYMNYVIKHKSAVLAGINAYLYQWGMLYISEFFVEETYRRQGLGNQLLEHVESEARAKGGLLSHCDTFDFQAKDFYLKHGYQVFGVLEDCPPGHRRYYLSKKLV